MNSQRHCFVLGLKRLIVFLAIALAMLVIMSVLGYWLLELGIAYVTSPIALQGHIGHAFEMALVGMLNLIFLLMCAVFVYAITAIAYLFIITIGGYDFSKENE